MPVEVKKSNGKTSVSRGDFHWTEVMILFLFKL